MTITYSEFLTRLLGAQMSDYRMPNLAIEDWLWSRFAFGDDGAHYLQQLSEPPAQPGMDLWAARQPGLCIPDVHILQ